MSEAVEELLRATASTPELVTAQVEAMLTTRWDAARSRWPDVDVPLAIYGPYVLARVPDERPPIEVLPEMACEDLYLACACGLGDSRALLAFEREVLTGVDRHLRRLATDATSVDDLKQRLRQKLLVGDEGMAPRIASYEGRSELAAWVRVVAVREGLMARRRRRPTSTDDDALLEAAGGQEDPELELMRARYRAEFRDAFVHALGGLDPAERNLLRFHLVDRLSIDKIAALQGVHRATAARRLAKVRGHLHQATRDSLMRRLSIGTDELDSILRLVRSQLEVSVRRLLVAD